MKSLKSIAIALMAFGALAAQGADVTPSNRYITRKVNSGAFTAIRTNTSLDIVYTVGPRDIEIYAPDNLMPYIQVAIKGSELIVSYKENMNIHGSHKSHIKISAPDVNKFTTASAGDIDIKSPIRLNNQTVEMRVLSAGDITAKAIEASEIRLQTNSAGDIETGSLKAENVFLMVNSAGDIETENVTARNKATVSVNSAGDVEVPEIVAGGMVSLSTNSAGDIKITTVSAPSASISTNSSGDIRVSELKADDVSASSGSSGNINLSGVCSSASLSARSVGDVNAKGLKAKDVDASVSSSGNVTCYAVNSLLARRSSVGEIRYAGNPSTVKIESNRKDGVRPL